MASRPMNTDAYCRHCGKRIAYAVAWTGYWYHVATQSVYCDLSATVRAQP